MLHKLIGFCFCLLFSFGIVYHHVVPLSGVPTAAGIPADDTGQMIWDLWFVNESMTHGHSPYRTTLVFYPAGANLSHHTIAAGYFPVTLIVKLFARGDPLYPIYAYHLIILLGFTLILYFTFLALHEWGFAGWSAAIPAVAYAFSSFFKEHALHINQLAGFTIPLCALCLTRFYKRPSWVNAITCAAAFAYALYLTEFALYIYSATALFVIGLLTISEQRKIIREKFRLLGLRRLSVAIALFAMLIAPYAYYWLTDSVIQPARQELSAFSANLLGFLIPNRIQTPLYDNLFSRLDQNLTMGIGGHEIFIGFPLLLLAVIGAFRPKSKYLRIAGLLAVLCFLLSLGPTLKIAGTDTGLPLPYALVMNVPPFNASRSPVRFVVFGLFFLAIVAAGGIEWLKSREAARFMNQRARQIVLPAILVWTIVESYSFITAQKPYSPPKAIESIAPGPVLNVPPILNDGLACLLQIFHGQPIATGYLARMSEKQISQYAELKQLFDRGDDDFCRKAQSRGYQNIIVAPNYVLAPALSKPLSHCEIPLVDLRRGTTAEFDTSTAAGDSLLTTVGIPYLDYGRRIDFALDEAQEILGYGWSDREPSGRWTLARGAAIKFQMGERKPSVLRFRAAPFLVSGIIENQPVSFALNQQPIGTLIVRDPQPQEYVLSIPVELLRRSNLLSLDLESAQVPKNLGLGNDMRLLGIRVEWMQIDIAEK